MTEFGSYALGVLRLAGAVALLGVWGWALAAWLFRDATDAAERFAYASALAVGSVMALAYLAWGLGATLGSIVWSVVALGVAGAVSAWRCGTRPKWGPDAVKTARWAGFAAIVGILQGIWISDSADIFYHLAAARSLLLADRPLATDLMVAAPPPGGLDPTSGAWATVLAILSRMSGLEPVSVVRWVTPLLAVIITLSFLALVRRTVGPRGRLPAMILMLVVAYHLDFRWAVYPNRISLAFVAAALAALVLFAERRTAPAFAGAVLLAATVAGTHLVSFELLAAACGVFALAVLVRGERGRAWVVALCVACVLVGGLVAYSKVAPTIAATGGFSVGSPDRLVDPRANIPLLQAGPLALMLPGGWMQGSVLTLVGGLAVALFLLFGDRSRKAVSPGDLMAASIALILPLVAWNLLFTTLIVDRFWYHVVRVGAIWPIFLGVPVGALYTRLAEQNRRSWGRQLAIAVLATGVLLTGARLGPTIVGGPRDLASTWHSRTYDLIWGWGGHTDEIVEIIGDDGSAVIAAPLGLSYHASGLLPVRVIAVASAHMPSYAERLDGAERRRDVFTLLSPSVTKRETRQILERYQVGWFMTWTDNEGELLPSSVRHVDDWPDVFEPVYRANGVALFRVRPLD